DTYPDAEGIERAWIGLVPFTMSGIRFERGPLVPGCSAFHETNVRTYVHRNGDEPGVWFYSLDAGNPFACAYARRFFGLPYSYAGLRLRGNGSSEKLASARGVTWSLSGETKIGEELPPAAPGTLEFFLVERYLLYAVRRGVLSTGRVSHVPYQIHRAEFQG